MWLRNEVVHSLCPLVSVIVYYFPTAFKLVHCYSRNKMVRVAVAKFGHQRRILNDFVQGRRNSRFVLHEVSLRDITFIA